MAVLSTAALDRLMPMHALVSRAGVVRHAGPTLRKLRPETCFAGARFLDVFELRRPQTATRIADLWHTTGTSVQIQFRTPPETALTGLAIALPDDEALLVNLSFGISVVDAVRDYELTLGDFAPTDLAVEMLYLVEAKSAAMEQSRDLNRRLEGARIAAEERAFTDTLTGLKNRRALEHVLSRMQETGLSYAIMQLDLDFFKNVNDAYGHAAGDHVLQHVAHVLLEQTRSDDTMVRAGGDEFVMIFPRLTNHGKLVEIAARVIDRLEEPIHFAGHHCDVSASVGIALSTDFAGCDYTAVLEGADAALYAAKRRGRGRVATYGDEPLAAGPEEMPLGPGPDLAGRR